MKTRIALPILLASFGIMLVGLHMASAQDDGPGPGIRPPIRRPMLPRPAGGGEAGGGPTAATGNLQPFEAGIEYRPTPSGARIEFNVEDADLPDLVRLISQLTGKRFILSAKARSIKATVYAPGKVTVGEAYQAFLSILQLNGMTVVPTGRYLKIVETQGIQGDAIATYTAGDATPADDRYLTRMHGLSNVSADDVVQLLTKFKSPEGDLTAYAPTNTIIMTDRGSIIRRMLRIVEAIDVARTGEQVWVEPVHYANANELAGRLTEIFPVGDAPAAGAPAGAGRAPRPPRPDNNAPEGGPPGGGGSTTIGTGEARITKILADERTNSLIIMATERAYLRILEMIRVLDVAIEGEGRIHVHYIQHGDAEEISSTLSGLVGGGGGTPRAGGEAGAGASIFEGQIKVTAHKPTNSLVITSSLHDYAALRNVINRLDSPRRQVFIEAVIMELSTIRSSKLGLSFHAPIPGLPIPGMEAGLGVAGSNIQGSGTAPLNAESLTGLAFGIRGPTVEGLGSVAGLPGVSLPSFGVVLNAMATSGDVNVLSTPHLIASDNVQAEINVGSNIPLQQNGAGGLGGLGGLSGLLGGAGQNGAAGLAGLAGLAGGGVQRQDVGTRIRITPHVNESDEIRMEIEEEVSSPGAALGDLGVVSVDKKTAKTEVVVRDQQTVVIGGLMRDVVTTTESKIPILGDIPLLGMLFRQTERRTEKQNLLLILTPYIIRTPTDLRSIYERKMRERQEFLDRYFVFGDDNDYQPPIDHSRTRGLIGEMITEVKSIEEERRLADAAQSRPTPNHVPRQAVGSQSRGTGEAGEVIINPDGSSSTVSARAAAGSTAEPAPAEPPVLEQE